MLSVNKTDKAAIEIRSYPGTITWSVPFLMEPFPICLAIENSVVLRNRSHLTTTI